MKQNPMERVNYDCFVTKSTKSDVVSVRFSESCEKITCEYTDIS